MINWSKQQGPKFMKQFQSHVGFFWMVEYSSGISNAKRIYGDVKAKQLEIFWNLLLVFQPPPEKKKNSSHCAPHICKGRSMPNPCSLLAPAAFARVDTLSKGEALEHPRFADVWKSTGLQFHNLPWTMVGAWKWSLQQCPESSVTCPPTKL